MPYRIEYASSARAGCKGTECAKSKAKIGKGELRFGTWVETENFQSFSWRHWGCVTPKQLKNIVEKLGGDYGDLDGFDEISLEDREKFLKAVAQLHVDDNDLTEGKDANKNHPDAEEVAKKARQEEKEAEKTKKSAQKEAKKAEAKAKKDNEGSQEKLKSEKPTKSKKRKQEPAEPSSEDEKPSARPIKKSKPRRVPRADDDIDGSTLEKNGVLKTDEVASPKPRQVSRRSARHKS